MSTRDVTMGHLDQGLSATQSKNIFAGFTRWMGSVADLVLGASGSEARADRGVAMLALAGSCSGEWISDEVWQAIHEAAGLNRSKQEEESNV